MKKNILVVFFVLSFFVLSKINVFAWGIGPIQFPNAETKVEIPDFNQEIQNRLENVETQIENRVTDEINQGIRNQTQNVQQGLLDPIIRGANDALKEAGLNDLQIKAQDFIRNTIDLQNLEKFINEQILNKNLTQQEKEDLINQYVNNQINQQNIDAGVSVVPITYTENQLGQVATGGLLAGKDAKPTIGQIVSKVLPYVYIIAGLSLLLLLIWGGITLMTAAGNPDKAKQGYGILSGALIGFLIVFISYFVVQLVQVMLGVKIL